MSGKRLVFLYKSIIKDINNKLDIKKDTDKAFIRK